MKRRTLWRTALAEYIRQVSRKPFAWGSHDCALFAAGAVAAMTGEDFGSPYRGKYKTLRGGLGMLRRKGFKDHSELAASLFEEIPAAQANVGDVAAVEENGHVALGIVQGERIYVLRPEASGIGTVGLLEANRVFRVPFQAE